ncbi:MAG TPA: hypothetical protein VID28_11230 [Methylomirabilota bacterium]|jgi:hypothetical protein
MASGEPTTVYTVGDFVRRVVDSLLRSDRRGMRLCARCLVKLTREHLDKSYSKTAIVETVDEIFSAPGALSLAPSSVCAACGRKKTPCLGVAAEPPPTPEAR